MSQKLVEKTVTFLVLGLGSAVVSYFNKDKGKQLFEKAKDILQN